MRAPGSHPPPGPSSPTGAALVYAVLTCENVPPDGHRLHVRTDGTAHHSMRPCVRLIHGSRTYSGQDLGTASGSANRSLSRIVTVSATTRPRRRTSRPRPPRHPRACHPGHCHRLLWWRTDPALPSSPPGLPRLAKRAAVIRNRREHDLEGQAAAAPGARRPVIAQGPPSPLAGDDQRVTAGQRRPRRGIARTKTETRPWIQNDSGLMGALDPGTASIAPVARFGMGGKAEPLDAGQRPLSPHCG